MTVRTEGETRIEDGTGTVVAIERKTRNAKVSLEVQGLKYPVSAWIDLDELDVNLGTDDRVTYEIRKEGEDGYRRYTLLAPVTTQKGSGGAEAQTPTAAPPPVQGRGDAVGGGGSGPSPTAERDVPNTDTARFEGWGYAGGLNIVCLTFGELSDAVEGGDLDKIDAVLQRRTAEVLLNAADQAQRALVGRTDRSALSHKAARDAVRAVVDKRPLRGGIDDIPAWVADVERTAVRLLQLAATL